MATGILTQVPRLSMLTLTPPQVIIKQPLTISVVVTEAKAILYTVERIAGTFHAGQGAAL